MEDKLDLLGKRHSVRSYDPTPLADNVKNKLRSEATYINCHEAGLNFQICFDDKSPFDGWKRSYGMFKNVSNYLAAVIDPTFPHAAERAGYYGEQFVMEAVGLGLGTCFVGVTYSSSHIGATVEVYEKVPFLIAFGNRAASPSFIERMTKSFIHRGKVSPRDFFEGSETDYNELIRRFPWLLRALKAVACAPSSLNKRPVRLRLKEHEGRAHIAAFVPDEDSQAVDLGIAKYNVAAAVPGHWDWGNGGVFYPDNEE